MTFIGMMIHIIDLCYLFFRKWFNFFLYKVSRFQPLNLWTSYILLFFLFVQDRISISKVYFMPNTITFFYFFYCGIHEWFAQWPWDLPFNIWISLTGFYNLYIKNTLISTYETSVHLLTKYRHTGFLKGSVI